MKTKILVLLALSSAPIAAQSLFGTILGTITDNAQAVVAGATVRVRNMETNAVRTVQTDRTGDYEAPSLPVGEYEVACEVPGFKRAVVSRVTLEVDQRARVDIRLELGEVNQKVEVTGSTAIMETDSASQGTVIDNRTIVDLPLNGRNFEQLATLGPGVVAPVSGAGNNAYFSVSGTRGIGNSFMMDGATNTNNNANVPFISPSIDLIEEFKIQRNTFNAEYGRGASQINVVTKSGTNSIHGTLFEFFRNNDLNARNFFDPAIKPELRLNQFGGTIGGPLVVPKLYNGRNKTFWLFNYEGVRQRVPATKNSALPTEAQLSGDLSTVATASIKDPLTGGTIFPNKQIPASLIDPTSKVFIGYMPAVTALPGVDGPGINLISPISTQTGFDQVTAKIDEQIGSNNHAFVRYTRNLTASMTPGIAPQYTTAAPSLDLNAVAGLNTVIRPNLINEFRAGFSRHMLHQGSGYETNANFAQQMGLQNTLSAEPQFNSLPSVAISGYTTVGGSALITQRCNTFSYLDNLTWLEGNHTFKAGFDIRHEMLDVRNIGATEGSFSFTGTLSGNAIADFLLGIPASASAAAPPGPNGVNISNVWTAFVQDDWKIRPDLTLNLGVRWEYDSPFINDRGERSIFDPTFPGGRLIYGNMADYYVPGQGFVPTSKPLTSPGLVPGQYYNFAPRFGFAWRPFNNNRNVVRGSYGIFYDEPNYNNEILFGSFNYPDELSYSLTNPVASPTYIWSKNVFPPQASVGTVTFNSLSPTMPVGYIQQWSFNLQREITSNLVAEVGYMGSKGTRLDWRNYADQAVLETNPAQPTSIASREPFPAFGQGSLLISSNGFSTYDAFIARLERRFSHGLQFLISYTHSKSIDNSSFAGNIGAQPAQPEDEYDRKLERGLSYFDVPNRLAISYIWNIPYNPSRRLLQFFLGGWQLTGITQMQTGNPWSILISTDTANVGTGGTQRTEQVGVVYPSGFVSGGPSRLAFNSKAFALPAAGTFGDTGRNIVRTAPLNNWDTGINKSFRVNERAHFQFRGEIFNIWNHTQFVEFDNTFQDVGFGTWTSAQSPRIIQFALKLIY